MNTKQNQGLERLPYEAILTRMMHNVEITPDINETNKQTLFAFNKKILTQITSKGQARKSATRQKLMQDTSQMAKLLGPKTFEELASDEKEYDSFQDMIRGQPNWLSLIHI